MHTVADAKNGATLRSGRMTRLAADNACLLEIRIISNEIKLPARRMGFYACSEYGLALAVDLTHKGFTNGDKLCVDLLTEPEHLERDKKSDALEITVD
ncbi:MAG: hypothetical protein ACTTKL_10190 [Treponema sp.]